MSNNRRYVNNQDNQEGSMQVKRLRICTSKLPSTTAYKDMPEVNDAVVKGIRAADANYRSRVNPTYPILQTNVSHQRRAEVVDWLMDISRHYSLKRESFHCGIQLIDRFFSLTTEPLLSKSSLQLIAVTALWIATKLEESSLPSVKDFAHSTGESYTVEQLRSTEHRILAALDFDVLSVPTPYDFVCYYLYRLASGDGSVIPFDAGRPRCWMRGNVLNPAHVKRIMEMVDTAMIDLDSICFVPSKIASTAIYYYSDESKAFSDAAIEEVTGYPRASLANCMAWFGFIALLPAVPEELVVANIRMTLPRNEFYTIQHFNPHSFELVKRMYQERPKHRHPAIYFELNGKSITGKNTV